MNALHAIVPRAIATVALGAALTAAPAMAQQVTKQDGPGITNFASAPMMIPDRIAAITVNMDHLQRGTTAS